MMILSSFELFLVSIMACYCIMKIYKKYGLENAIILILGGIAISFSGSTFNKYIGKNIETPTDIIIAGVILAGIIGYYLWKKYKKK